MDSRFVTDCRITMRAAVVVTGDNPLETTPPTNDPLPKIPPPPEITPDPRVLVSLRVRNMVLVTVFR